MISETVRTRFAPSPTGEPHIGNIRSALYAYLWARKNGGSFILRIEDTDAARTVKGSLDAILDGLTWLGIDWDEGPIKGGDYGPYIQSERIDIYKEHIDQLVKGGAAYYCFCSKEELDELRTKQQECHEAPKYDKRCNKLAEDEVKRRLKNGDEHTVRLSVPDEGEIVVKDRVRGDVTFNAKDIDDQVLLKSDGFPTYHLANVVDDHLMGVTHIIRGEEWLPSTPKHILLYQAFGWDVPEWVHLSLFLSSKGGKMSKRQGEMSLLSFRDKGYLPEAIVNFIALLGWNPKTTEELFTLEQLEQRFDIAQINAPNPVFDTDKLDWMNQQYLQKLDRYDILRRIKSLSEMESDYRGTYEAFLQWFGDFDDNKQESVIHYLKERSKTLLDVANSYEILHMPDYEGDKLIWKKSDKNGTIEALKGIYQLLEKVDSSEYVAVSLEKSILEWISDNGLKNGDVLWPTRLALSGMEKSPPPFELAEILGKEESLNRIEQAIEKLK
ncbi:MAG: glutamate--tRNA ligase [Candidatus Kerfeldbacteria bacterium]